jgi:hypothetical protein
VVNKVPDDDPGEPHGFLSLKQHSCGLNVLLCGEILKPRWDKDLHACGYQLLFGPAPKFLLTDLGDCILEPGKGLGFTIDNLTVKTFVENVPDIWMRACLVKLLARWILKDSLFSFALKSIKSWNEMGL